MVCFKVCSLNIVLVLQLDFDWNGNGNREELCWQLTDGC